MICVKCGKEAPDAPFCALCGWKQAKGEPGRKTKRGNGEGRVWKRGKTWYAQVTLYTQAAITDGEKVLRQKRRTKGGFATKKDALDYIAVLRGPQARRVPTLLELYTQWEKKDLPNLSKDKQAAYKKARERLDSLMGRKIDSLTTADLQAVVDAEASSYYTARDMKTLLSHLYKKALPDQFVSDNLSSYIVLPALDEKEAEPFTSEEVQKIWQAFAGGDDFAGYFLLMIYTGMMPGELFICKKDMIDYERCEIWGCGKKTKARKEVPIVFPAFLAPVLERLVAVEHPTQAGHRKRDFLQPMREAEWYGAYHEATKRIGIRDLPPYSCRHTTGTEAAKLNLSAPVLQQVMRHSKITTTQRYIHLGTDEAHAAVNQMPAQKSDASSCESA